ncbi:MAG: ribonuclease P protein component [Verrucomicrobia bacterium]|nr:ribonuclease P protein component [Verrucomicrobiota bacterium]|tara:strand:- start:1939 stop:2334 length:396 start_codon:yes stop_codon:yes gene_type:complete
MQFQLNKTERLYKKSEIDHLFKNGKRLHEPPLTVIHALLPEQDNSSRVKFMVGVPKKKFKKAVDRNLYRRRIREAYRLHRNPLKSCLGDHSHPLGLVFLYNGNQGNNYKEIEVKIILLLRRLEDIYAEHHR